MGGAALGPGEIQRDVVMSLTVQRLGMDSGEAPELRLDLPLAQSPYHAMRALEVPESVAIEMVSDLGPAVAVVDLSDLRPFESRHIAMRLQLGFRGVPLPQILVDREMYTEQETCLLLEGKVTVSDDKDSVSFGSGDMVVFPKDLECTWRVSEAVTKHYNFG